MTCVLDGNVNITVGKCTASVFWDENSISHNAPRHYVPSNKNTEINEAFVKHHNLRLLLNPTAVTINRVAFLAAYDMACKRIEKVNYFFPVCVLIMLS